MTFLPRGVSNSKGNQMNIRPGLEEAGLLLSPVFSSILLWISSRGMLAKLTHPHSLLSSGQIKLLLAAKPPLFIVLWKETVDIWSQWFQVSKPLSKNSGNCACLVWIPAWSHLFFIYCYTKTFRVNLQILGSLKRAELFNPFVVG